MQTLVYGKDVIVLILKSALNFNIKYSFVGETL
jgi:hypothetical protein